MPNNMPLVSISIPCYNYGRFLGESIESVINQTYKPIEITVVNDGSTDNTIDIAQRYPVKLVNQSNIGIARTLNKCIGLSQGDYYVLLSADDKLYPTFVEKTIKILLEHPEVAFAYGYGFFFGNTQGIIKGPDYSLSLVKNGMLKGGCALVRKSAFLQTTGFDPTLKCLEDWDLWLSFAENGFYGKLIPEPLHFYRQHGQSRGKVALAIATREYRKILKKHSSLYTLLEWELLDKKAIYASLKEKLLPRGTCRRENYDCVTRQIKNLFRT